MSEARQDQPRAQSAEHSGLPLAGLRVIDLTLARAGPTCVRHLADCGTLFSSLTIDGSGAR